MAHVSPFYTKIISAVRQFHRPAIQHGIFNCTLPVSLLMITPDFVPSLASRFAKFDLLKQGRWRLPGKNGLSQPCKQSVKIIGLRNVDALQDTAKSLLLEHQWTCCGQGLTQRLDMCFCFLPPQYLTIKRLQRTDCSTAPRSLFLQTHSMH